MKGIWDEFCALLGWRIEELNTQRKRGRPRPVRLWRPGSADQPPYSDDFRSHAELDRTLRYHATWWLIKDDLCDAVVTFVQANDDQRRAVVELIDATVPRSTRPLWDCPVLKRFHDLECAARQSAEARYARLPRGWLDRVTCLTHTMTGTCDAERYLARLRQRDVEALALCMGSPPQPGRRHRL